MKSYEINTTAYDEENFVILTDLTEVQIKKVLEPIVNRERNGGDNYNNDMLIDALLDAYPENEFYAYIKPKLISI
jgi:hypothetical protein